MGLLLPSLLLCLFVVAHAAAQQVLQLDRLGRAEMEVIQQLDRPPKSNALQCEFVSYRPFFSFALRYQAGYRAWVSLRGMEGGPAQFHVVFRVTPTKPAGDPVFFGESFRIPHIPPGRGLYYPINGGFFLGEGEYRVDWLLIDGMRRVHARNWTIKTGKPARDVVPAVAAGSVSPLRIDAWGEIESGIAQGEKLPVRALLLIHAASIRPRALELSYGDQIYLVHTLAALLRGAPFEEVSVVAFNLKQQRELLHSPHLTRDSFSELFDRLAKLELGTVDFSVLQRPKGHVDLLADILNRDVTSRNPPDVVIFIGPAIEDDDKIPPGLIAEEGAGFPPVYYLKYSPYFAYFRYLPASDVIEKLVKRLKGKTFDIFTPRNLAESVKDIADGLRKLPESGPLRHDPPVVGESASPRAAVESAIE